jgi:hypothetical protein
MKKLLILRTLDLLTAITHFGAAKAHGSRASALRTLSTKILGVAAILTVSSGPSMSQGCPLLPRFQVLYDRSAALIVQLKRTGDCSLLDQVIAIHREAHVICMEGASRYPSLCWCKPTPGGGGPVERQTLGKYCKPNGTQTAAAESSKRTNQEQAVGRKQAPEKAVSQPEVPPAKTAAVTTEIREACSLRADAQGLHGSARQAFRAQCKLGLSGSNAVGAPVASDPSAKIPPQQTAKVEPETRPSKSATEMPAPASKLDPTRTGDKRPQDAGACKDDMSNCGGGNSVMPPTTHPQVPWGLQNPRQLPTSSGQNQRQVQNPSPVYLLPNDTYRGARSGSTSTEPPVIAPWLEAIGAVLFGSLAEAEQLTNINTPVINTPVQQLTNINTPVQQGVESTQESNSFADSGGNFPDMNVQNSPDRGSYQYQDDDPRSRGILGSTNTPLPVPPEPSWWTRQEWKVEQWFSDKWDSLKNKELRCPDWLCD